MATSKTIITLMLITLVSVIGTGCSDDATSPVAVTPPVVDTAPPAVPYGLDGVYNSGSFTMSWDANTTDADFAGFSIQREHDGVVVALASLSSATSFVDSSVPYGLSSYEVYSVDFTGNESAITSVSYNRHQDHGEIDLY